MVIDFTIKNYLSIKDSISLSFLSNNKNIDKELKIISTENVKLNLYSFSAIYGQNASGKTNIVKALKDFRKFVLYSHRLDLDKPIPAYKPFKLDKENITAPIIFEIEFILDNIRYNYHIQFLEKEIIKEELNIFPEGRKAKLFTRLFEV